MSLCINIENVDTHVKHISPIISRKINEINVICVISKNFFDKCQCIGTGQFSKIYKLGSTVIKLSKILEKTNMLLLQNKLCSHTVKNYLYEFDNENFQVMTYSQLNKIYPKNILKILKTNTIKIKNNIFPINITIMDYVDGVTFYNFIVNYKSITFNEFDMLIQFDKILHDCLKVLLFANSIGLFHNDINLSNILITRSFNPVFIDYSFSKKIKHINKFPIECFILMSELKNVIPNIFNTKYFNDVYLIFSSLFIKYEIYDTNFIEKIICKKGTFTKKDYKNLKNISSFDLIQLRKIIESK